MDDLLAACFRIQPHLQSVRQYGYGLLRQAAPLPFCLFFKEAVNVVRYIAHLEQRHNSSIIYENCCKMHYIAMLSTFQNKQQPCLWTPPTAYVTIEV
jgi:hypothetical protein